MKRCIDRLGPLLSLSFSLMGCFSGDDFSDCEEDIQCGPARYCKANTCIFKDNLSTDQGQPRADFMRFPDVPLLQNEQGVAPELEVVHLNQDDIPANGIVDESGKRLIIAAGTQLVLAPKAPGFLHIKAQIIEVDGEIIADGSGHLAGGGGGGGPPIGGTPGEAGPGDSEWPATPGEMGGGSLGGDGGRGGGELIEETFCGGALGIGGLGETPPTVGGRGNFIPLLCEEFSPRLGCGGGGGGGGQGNSSGGGGGGAAGGAGGGAILLEATEYLYIRGILSVQGLSPGIRSGESQNGGLERGGDGGSATARRAEGVIQNAPEGPGAGFGGAEAGASAGGGSGGRIALRAPTLEFSDSHLMRFSGGDKDENGDGSLNGGQLLIQGSIRAGGDPNLFERNPAPEYDCRGSY